MLRYRLACAAPPLKKANPLSAIHPVTVVQRKANRSPPPVRACATHETTWRTVLTAVEMQRVGVSPSAAYASA